MTIGQLRLKSLKLTGKLALICLLAGLALALANVFVNRAHCTLYGKSLERETRYSFIVGCMVKTDNGWVPRNELRSEMN